VQFIVCFAADHIVAMKATTEAIDRALSLVLGSVRAHFPTVPARQIIRIDAFPAARAERIGSSVLPRAVLLEVATDGEIQACGGFALSYKFCADAARQPVRQDLCWDVLNVFAPTNEHVLPLEAYDVADARCVIVDKDGGYVVDARILLRLAFCCRW
jgi:hypothetical protein